MSPNKHKPIMSDAKATSWIRRILDWGPWGCSWFTVVPLAVGLVAWYVLK